LNRRFNAWPRTGRVVPAYDYAPKNPVKGNVFFVHKEFTQSRFTVGRLGLDQHNPDHFAVELADYILGGSGPSRLFNEIRSRQGLAYMVGSFSLERRGTGLVGAVCQTKAESTALALAGVREQMNKMAAGPIRDEEVSLAKDAILNSFVFRVNSRANVVEQEAGYEFEGFPAGYLAAYPSHVNAVNKEEIQRVAKKYYAPDGLTILVVGDRAKLGDGLKKFGEVVEIPLEKID
jgi:zinc protease